MPIDNDNSDYEAKRAEQRRQIEKQQIKAQQERDPLRSFEAKLSTQAAKEEAARESLKKTDREVKKMLEDKGDFLRKVLGEKDVNSAADLQARAKRHEQEFAKQKGLIARDLGEKIQEKRDDRKKTDSQHESETDDAQNTAEGHKKVVEIETHDDGSAGQGFSGGGGDSQDSNDRGFDSGAGDSAFGKPDQTDGLNVKAFAEAGDFSGSDGGAQFSFSREDLDQIVASIQHNFLANGEEVFAVQLTNEFYDGLKIEATRTERGVVLTFLCPNVLVRTQMLRQKDAIRARFADKQIQVREVRFQ